MSLNFIAPAFIDDEIKIYGEIMRISHSTGIITIKTKIMRENTTLVMGEAKVLIP
jgi:acyl-CoA thioesterase FadM